MGRLDGRIAIVTGGAKGIGRHYSRALAAEGARVMIADVVDGTEVGEAIARDHGDNSARNPRLWTWSPEPSNASAKSTS